MLIYKATNRVNGKEYVGQTINSLEYRKKTHISAALNSTNKLYFHSAIRKYGAGSFDWEVLHTCNNIDDLNKLEIYYIGLYNTFGGGYNLNSGGHNACCPEETKRKISETKKGSKATEETKKKMSESRKNALKSGKCKMASGKDHPWYGKHLPVEVRKKISDSHKGMKHTTKSKRKMSESWKGKRCGKDNPSAKVIIINNQYFNTRKEAAEFLGVSPPAIRYRILHKTKWLNYFYKGEYDGN